MCGGGKLLFLFVNDDGALGKEGGDSADGGPDGKESGTDNAEGKRNGDQGFALFVFDGERVSIAFFDKSFNGGQNLITADFEFFDQFIAIGIRF